MVIFHLGPSQRGRGCGWCKVHGISLPCTGPWLINIPEGFDFSNKNTGNRSLWKENKHLQSSFYQSKSCRGRSFARGKRCQEKAKTIAAPAEICACHLAKISRKGEKKKKSGKKIPLCRGFTLKRSTAEVGFAGSLKDCFPFPGQPHLLTCPDSLPKEVIEIQD